VTLQAINAVLEALEQIREAQGRRPTNDRCTWEEAQKTAAKALDYARRSPEDREALLLKGAAWALFAHELLTRP
jgi:hypothetical protein